MLLIYLKSAGLFRQSTSFKSQWISSSIVFEYRIAGQQWYSTKFRLPSRVQLKIAGGNIRLLLSEQLKFAAIHRELHCSTAFRAIDAKSGPNPRIIDDESNAVEIRKTPLSLAVIIFCIALFMFPVLQAYAKDKMEMEVTKKCKEKPISYRIFIRDYVQKGRVAKIFYYPQIMKAVVSLKKEQGDGNQASPSLIVVIFPPTINLASIFDGVRTAANGEEIEIKLAENKLRIARIFLFMVACALMAASMKFPKRNKNAPKMF